MNVLLPMEAVSTHAVTQKGVMIVPALTTFFSAVMDTPALVRITVVSTVERSFAMSNIVDL